MVRGFIVSRDAPLTVDASCMMLTFYADTSPFILVIIIFAGLVAIDLWIIVAVVGMTIAIARLAFISAVSRSWFPG